MSSVVAVEDGHTRSMPGFPGGSRTDAIVIAYNPMKWADWSGRTGVSQAKLQKRCNDGPRGKTT